MISKRVFLLFGFLLHSQSALGVFWSCSTDSECSSMADSVCVGGSCVCPPGRQSVLGGTVCASVAPYISSECREDFQCSNLFTAFQCRRTSEDAGRCFCAPGHHYFRGRCWPSTELGEECSRDEQCQWVINDPFSMKCDGVCACAEGYYLRQRGECRRSGLVVGDHCVLDEDCRFEDGACNIATFTCYDTTAEPEEPDAFAQNLNTGAVLPERMGSRQYASVCDVSTPCPDPFQCSAFGVCLCPTGYYPNADNTICLAELGSPVTSPDQCVGLFTEVRDGFCSCQANFFFNEDMRTCVKVARFITDFCMGDESCHTFGAHARCGPPQQWGLRSCECNLEETVWDVNRSLCRVFAGIGETCSVDSDCMAGDLEVRCELDDEGEGRCACPEGLVAYEGLCLTLGRELGESCQVNLECSETPNAVCSEGVCSCDAGYQPVGDVCAPALGGTCTLDEDCQIPNTACSASTSTCQCQQQFVEAQELCWPRVAGYQSPCNVTQQCTAAMGVGSDCADERCVCVGSYHHRDGSCWQQIGLFETCARSSECYLSSGSERVECRNSLCQCTFDYPFSEELGTCRSSASAIFGSSMIIVIALFYLFSR